MQSAAFLQILRALLLLGLLAAFSWSLVTSLLAERAARGIGPPGAPLGIDPGLRVLLGAPGGEDGFQRLAITVLQPALLYCPDDPLVPALQMVLTAQQRLELRPDIAGIAIEVTGGQQLWQVGRLALRPHESGSGPDDLPPPDLATFEAANAGALCQLNGNRYRGSLEIVLAGQGRLQVVNALPIEAYVEGVVQTEMRDYWPLEALKAQAIAARSYAFAQRWKSSSAAGGLLHYHLRDGGLDPAYRGTDRGGTKISWAVSDSRGQVLTYFGVPFAAWFHPSSGGFTAGIESVRPGARSADGSLALADLMPAHADPYCEEGVKALDKLDSHWRHETVISTAQLRQALIKRGLDNHWVYDMEVERLPSGRVQRVVLKILPDKQLALSGDQFRRMIGPSELRSTLWTPESPQKLEGAGQESGGYRIQSIGWGHGVGMSQVSAYAMARNGSSAAAILGYFYIGAQIERRW